MSTVIKVKAIVDSIDSYGETVHKVLMHVSDRKLPRIKPGQFLHLALDDYDPNGGFWPDSRVFSIASLAKETLQIVYSVKGKFTTRMENELLPGRIVWLKLPFGNFVVETGSEAQQNVVLVAGGTGVSPFIPFLEKCISEGFKGETLRLYYGARRISHLLFPDLLEQCEREVDSFKCKRYVEQVDGEAASKNIGEYLVGKLDIAAIAQECGVKSTYYLSGPPQMISTFRERLREKGVSETGIRVDEWE